MEDRDKYVAEYWKCEKQGKTPDFVPDEYSRTSGSPRPMTVGAEKFAELNTPEAKKRCGVKYWR
jgi:hypothetical protein